jgi:hypothetical protein
MKEIKDCEVCGNDILIKVHDLGLHPLCDDLIKIGSDQRCKEYPIQILYCTNCKTAHQRYQIPKRELFPKNYHYRARMTASVLQGMKDLVLSCESNYGELDKKLVLDIGCNDGSLLNFFKEKGCKTIGVEPTNSAKDSIHFTINSFFDKNTAEQILNQVGKPDFITFTNVFAHIENLRELLENVKKIMHKKTLLIIENHYLGAILKYSQFDTYYHEHPRTYSFTSFVHIAKNLGLNVINCEFQERYGGNIRVHIGNEYKIKEFSHIDETEFESYFLRNNQVILNWKQDTRKLINEYNLKNGKIRAKAFPGRAAMLLRLLDLNEDNISAVYEIKGSLKVGHYVPGTRIPIFPEADLYSENDITQPILNLAWHIPNEVRQNLLNNGYKGKVIDIKNFQVLS